MTGARKHADPGLGRAVAPWRADDDWRLLIGIGLAPAAGFALWRSTRGTPEPGPALAHPLGVDHAGPAFPCVMRLAASGPRAESPHGRVDRDPFFLLFSAGTWGNPRPGFAHRTRCDADSVIIRSTQPPEAGRAVALVAPPAGFFMRPRKMDAPRPRKAPPEGERTTRPRKTNAERTTQNA